MPHETLEEHHARRVEVRGFGHVVVDRAGLLRGRVKRQPQRSVAQSVLLGDGANRPKIHQLDVLNGPFLVDDEVRRAHGPVQHPVSMEVLQGVQQRVGHTQRFLKLQRALRQTAAKRDAGGTLEHHVEAVRLAPRVKQGSEPRALDRPQYGCLVLQPHQGAGLHHAGRDRLDDHRYLTQHVETGNGLRLARNPGGRWKAVAACHQAVFTRRRIRVDSNAGIGKQGRKLALAPRSGAAKGVHTTLAQSQEQYNPDGCICRAYRDWDASSGRGLAEG